MNKFKKIREMIQQPCNVVFTVSFMVKYYKEVVEEWNYYKRTGKVRYEKESERFKIERIFNFHLNGGDHILLYYSANKQQCLWMCKVDEKYINLIVPAASLGAKSKSIIATYTAT
jgi:hypothetical protein